MKVIYISRLFSGLEQSIIDRKWKPTGVPTIYRFLEKLESESDELNIIFAIKDGFLKKKYSRNLKLKLEPFKNKIVVLSVQKIFNFLPKRFHIVFREVSYTLFYFIKIIKLKPDIIYIDHANIWSASLISRFFKIPTVFRVMGIYPVMRDALNKRNFKSIVLKWFYKSPFRNVICTQDGSGVELWLKRAINKKTTVEVMINGVSKKLLNYSKDFELKKNDDIVISFIGKIESSKGAEEFVRAAILSLNNCKLKLKFLIIGSGSLRKKLIEITKEKGCINSFEFIEKVENKNIINFLVKTDIYVSLNKYGNLSNSNLEAIAIGKCIIMPKSQPYLGIDVVTDKLIPVSAVKRVKSNSDIKDISNAICLLAKNLETRKEMEREIKKIGLKLNDWDTRISKEITILKKIIKEK